jgi:hypothetical protein
VMINALYLWGRASAATVISNTALKLIRASTASTGGAAFTPRTRSSQTPTGVALVPALSTWSTAPTAGAFLAAPDIEIGCLSAGAAYWMPYDPDAAIRLQPAGTGAQGNIDAVSQGTAPLLAFRYALEFYERQ